MLTPSIPQAATPAPGSGGTSILVFVLGLPRASADRNSYLAKRPKLARGNRARRHLNSGTILRGVGFLSVATVPVKGRSG